MAGDIIHGIPFDASEILTPEGELEYDYTIFSQDLANWWGAYFTNGIIVPNGQVLNDEMKVEQSTTSSIVINPGTIMVNGRTGPLTEEYTINISPAASANERIDRIVIELNLNEAVNEFRPLVIQGTEATENPTIPLITRDDELKIYQMSLARVRVNYDGIIEVIDERSDDTVCGLCQVTVAMKPPLPVTGDEASNIAYDGSTSGLSAENVQDAIDELVSGEYSRVLLANSWTAIEEGIGYSQSVSISGFTSSMKSPIVDVVPATVEEDRAWGNIWKAETGNGILTFYAEESPSVDLNIKIKVVK